MTKLYAELADWYPLITGPSEYEEEATWYTKQIRAFAERDVRSVLELGCGVGANASFMKQWFDIVLVDLSVEMLRICRRINPDLEQHEGDMRTYRDPRAFDAVFVHDAASYLTSPADLEALANNAARHLEPGGVALICPDDMAENFESDSDCGGLDDPSGRGARYLSWSIPGPTANIVITDYVFMLRSPDGDVRVVHDRHTTGRLSQDTWRTAFARAGLTPHIVALEHSDVEPGRHHVVAATKPID